MCRQCVLPSNTKGMLQIFLKLRHKPFVGRSSDFLPLHWEMRFRVSIHQRNFFLRFVEMETNQYQSFYSLQQEVSFGGLDFCRSNELLRKIGGVMSEVFERILTQVRMMVHRHQPTENCRK
jgi:hypothetical protein